MKVLKKSIALLLCMVLVLGMLPATMVQAEEADTTDTGMKFELQVQDSCKTVLTGAEHEVSFDLYFVAGTSDFTMMSVQTTITADETYWTGKTELFAFESAFEKYTSDASCSDGIVSVSAACSKTDNAVTVKAGNKQKIGTLTLLTTSSCNAGQIGLSFATGTSAVHEVMDSDNTSSDITSFVTTNATVNIVAPDSVVITGPDTVDPVKGEGDYTYFRNWRATYYSTTGVAAENPMIKWSIAASTGAAEGDFSWDSTQGLGVKPTVANGTIVTLTATVGSGENAVQASKIITVQKADSVPTTCSLTASNGSTIAGSLSGRRAGAGEDFNGYMANTYDDNILTLPSPTATDGDTTYTFALTVYDQYGVEVTDFGSELWRPNQSDETTYSANTLTIPVGYSNGRLSVAILSNKYKMSGKNAWDGMSFIIKVEKEASAPTSIEITSNPATIVIPTTDTPNTQTFTATVKDQYGEAMTGQTVSWSGIGDNLAGVSGTLGENNTYTVSVSKDASVTTLPITLTATVTDATGVTGTASINLAELTFTNVPQHNSSKLVYGNSPDDIFDVKFAYGSRSDATQVTAKLGDTPITGTYKLYSTSNKDDLDDTNADINTEGSIWPAGTWYYKILFNSTDEQYQNVLVTSGSFTLTPKPITVTGITAVDKTYDGTTAVELDFTNAKLDGILHSDEDYVALNTTHCTATADSKSVGNQKVTVEELSLTSIGATYNAYKVRNYTLTQPMGITVNITKTDLTADMVPVSPAVTYTGEEQKPTVTVTVNGNTLTEDEDYTVTFQRDGKVTTDFTSAGTIKVIVAGTGNCTGEVEKNFTINKAEQTGFEIDNLNNLHYGQSLAVSTTGGNGDGEVTWSITGGKEYATLIEEEGTKGETYWSILTTGVGSITLQATKDGDDNYEATTASKQFTIAKDGHIWGTDAAKTVNLMYNVTTEQSFPASEVAAVLDATVQTEGMPQERGTTVTIKNVPSSNSNSIFAAGYPKVVNNQIVYKLKDGLNVNNKDDYADITVSYSSNHFIDGNVVVRIMLVDKNQAMVTFGTDNSVTYNGSAQSPDAPTVTLSSGNADTSKISYTVKKDGANFAAGFEGMVDAGTYTIVATYEDESNYGQSALFTFTIEPASISDKLNQITGYTYDGTAKMPALTFSDTYVTSNDYTVAYQRNDTATDDLTSAGTVTVVVTGKNNYTGTDSKSFTIAQASLSGANITLTGTDDLTYNGEEQKPTAVKVEVSGKELVNTDYTVNYSDDVINAGTVTVTITAKDDGNYTGTKTTSYEIKSASLSDLVKEIEGTFTYDGTQKRPEVSFTDAKVTNADYEVSYGENINAGNNAGSVKVTGKGNYTGEVTKTFTINKASAPESLTDVEKSYKYSLTGQQTAQVSGVPNNAGTVGYEVTDDFTGNAYVSDVSVSESGLVSFNLKGQDTYNKDAFVTIPVRVTMQNYATQIVKVNISFTDRDAQQALVVNGITASTGKVALSMKCGETLALNVTGGSGSGEVTVTIESGTNYCLYIGTQKTVKAEAVGTVTLKVRKAGDTDYQDAEAMIVITIGKGTPAITGNVETETEAGKLVVKADKDAETFGEVLTADDFDVDGVLTWTGKNSDGEDVEINGNTKLEDVNLDTVNWTFAPESENYEPVTGGISQEKSSNAWWIIGGLGAIGGSSASPLDDFTDLDADAWYAEAVEYCLDEGLMSGTGNGKFSPNGGMTRAMVWTVLGRMSGETLNGTGANWYLDAQKWAVRTGVSDGTDPNGQITREELVTMLWRFAGSPKADVSALRWYGDSATISDWAREAMAWAVNASVVEGSNWNLTPNAVATRCQVAAIFMRYHKFG